jgi:ADP-ribosylglycohydrolase
MQISESLSFGDRLKGMIYGVAIGDSLGAPHEFRNVSPRIRYSGIIYDINLNVRFQFAEKILPAGSFTDDTQMTITLLRSLIKNNFVYDRDKVILDYLTWANQCDFLGRQTRKMLRGIKTIRGYKNREKATDFKDAQGNGSLMRSSPLFLVDDKSVVKDTSITNANDINTGCTLMYVTMIRDIFRGMRKEEIITHLMSLEFPKQVMDTLTVDRNVSGKTKGWVCNSLYVAIKAFMSYDRFEQAMRFINSIDDSDTDTNSSICGALFGAYIGYTGMNREEQTTENIKRIDKFSSNFPSDYTLHDVHEIVRACDRIKNTFVIPRE